jgi:nitrous oxide reductase accessory protein NosL
MKRPLLSGLLTVLFTLAACMVFAQTAADVDKHPTCTYCGMDRQKFAHSRMLVTYDDGSQFGACSIHCAALNMAVTLDKTPKAIEVADYNTKKLLDAQKATWVIGGKKPGVMTKNAKWAFEKPADAEAFIKESGGAVATYEDAMKATFEDMYSDIKMILEKRAKMRAMQQQQQQQQQQPQPK